MTDLNQYNAAIVTDSITTGSTEESYQEQGLESHQTLFPFQNYKKPISQL